ncbi:glucosamine-6-phosphate deaminase [Gemella haemolysans]|uniref:Glucosamine-6-phosphate deaminase n=1 Tax=Gemella haemolysans ATCC 10379 TaxID=546270 RepID=C5NWP2_9BACL|nr:glucosamine-6-phosphate deaminase [Gemella haemolysans]EER68537.1 glucosamine-6-phosphate deaminase [Gemella haemolysans ATCC 10379]
MKYLVFDSKQEASKEAYKILKSLIIENSTLGLATGGSPTGLYAEIIADHKAGNFSYKNVRSYNLDEYVGISYDHPESYHKFMETNLFDHIDIEKENTHVPDASAEDLEDALKSYQEALNDANIDVQLLGVGSNGHIGFNEPGTSFDTGVHIVDLKQETIEANSRFFNNDINLVPKQAVTMGIKDIMKAKHIILLAFGKAKQDAIRSLVADEEITENIPCTILKNHPSVYVIVDKEADFK